MAAQELDILLAKLRQLTPIRHFGAINSIASSGLNVIGLGHCGKLGDLVSIKIDKGNTIGGEITALNKDHVFVVPYGSLDGLSIGAEVELLSSDCVRPHESWIGGIFDSCGSPLDQRTPDFGLRDMPLKNQAPAAFNRKKIGSRLATGLNIFNTILPIVRGQRMGIFAGSGVGKSTLLGQLAQGLDSDVVVIALVGERGREVREFVDSVLGKAGMSKSVLIVATSDQAPILKRRAVWTAMAVAEYFRGRGQHVLLIVDSITRFAEAHREIALSSGEKPSLSAFPPSTGNLISALVERAGPGTENEGDITAIFSVLVAGSDMEEPIADICRGVLDGHVVLDRAIAERGRFPAIDVRKSVSRSLPEAASESENITIGNVRRILGTYFDSEAIIRTGIYEKGNNAEIDESIRLWPEFEQFFSGKLVASVESSFRELGAIIESRSS